jgi:two-component system, LytTR family, response regulator
MRALIIDDERLARKELSNLLQEYPEVEIVGECANAEEGIKMIQELNPDLIFLDVQMPDKSGFEMLEALESVPEVIFVTAYDEYALKAFDVSALDYLLKPVESERLGSAIQRVKEEIEQKAKSTGSVPFDQGKLSEDDQIFLKDGEKCWFVSLKDVRLFESEGNYVRVYFQNFKPLILKSLNALEDRLDEKSFFRANRKHIVNLKWIESVENWFNGGLRLVLKDGTQVEVSRRQSARFKELMSL